MNPVFATGHFTWQIILNMTNAPDSIWWQDPTSAAEQGKQLLVPEPEYARLHPEADPDGEDDGREAGPGQTQPRRKERLWCQGDDPHVGPEPDQGLSCEHLSRLITKL